jgi:outer membrane protein
MIALMVGLLLASNPAATPITLEEVRAAGLQNVEALRAALDAEKAAAGKRLSISPILPQVGMQTGISHTASGPQKIFTTAPVVQEDGSITYEQRAVEVPGSGRGNYNLSLTLTQLLYDGGKWWNDIARAGAADEAARGQLAEQRLSAQFEAERRFWELLRAQASRDVFVASVQRSQQQLERAQSLFTAGRAQKRDAIDAEINLGSDQVSVLRQEDTIARARNELLKWIARPDEPVYAVDPRTPPHEGEFALDALLEKARSKRPLLATLKARERVAEKAIEVAWAPFLPRVSGSMAYQRNAPGADPFFTDWTKQHAFNIGINMQWDIFSGFATTAQVESARQDLRAAKLNTEQAERELKGDLVLAQAVLTRANAVLKIVQKNESLARQSLEIATERYGAGASTSLEVRDAQVRLTQVELQSLQSRIDVEVARAQLRRLSGGEDR